MSADRLAEIKTRAEAAFGGPWHVLDADENGMHAVAVDGTVLVEVGDFCDAEFIAASRDDIPHLLALVESLTAERDALAEQLGLDPADIPEASPARGSHAAADRLPARARRRRSGRADRAGGQVMGPIEQDRRDFMAAFPDLYAYIEERVAARETERAGDDAAGARDGHSASSRVWARSGRWEAKWRRMLAEPTGQEGDQ